MAYSDFNLDTVRKTMGLTIITSPLFNKIEPVAATNWLQQAIEKGLQQALTTKLSKNKQKRDALLHLFYYLNCLNNFISKGLLVISS